MSKSLIVNADDFGLCKEISAGILKSYSEGIVTSTSVVVNGRYFNEAIPLIKDSGIDTGIHLTFTGGEKAVSGGVDGLVDDKGMFLKSYKKVIPRIIFKRFNCNALKKELSQQISMLMDAGIKINHIDSHQHLHLLPNVRNLVIDLAEKFKIKWIRIPHSTGIGIKDISINILGNALKSKLKKQGLRFTDRFGGFEYGGCMNENSLSLLLPKLKDGVTELMVHPGYDASKYYDWGYKWEDELKALTSEDIKTMVGRMGIVLTNFKEIQ